LIAVARDDELHRELVAASRSGAVVTGPRTIAAGDLREALLRPPGPGDHPTGQLHLQGVTVDGDLDLRGSTLAVQLTLIECEVLGGLNLLEASLPGLQLDRTTASWVDAANCVITLEVWLKESSFPSGVDFTDARVGGSIHLDGSVFGPGHRTDAISVLPAGCPVRMRRLTVGGVLSASRIDCLGLFDLANSRIGGDFELDGARLTAAGADGPVPGAALNAPDLRIAGSLTADPGRDLGRRSNVHAEVSPRRTGSSRTSDDPLEVTGRFHLPGVVIGGDVDLSGIVATGELCLQDARIQHNVHLQRARLHTAGGNAVNLHRATVGGSIDCGQVRAEGSLRLADVTAGSVFVSGAELAEPCHADPAIYQPGTRENRHDPLLNLIGAQITGTVRGNPAGRPFRARGSIALRGARVSRAVQFISAEIVSDEGLAVDASSLSCADLYLVKLDAVGGVRFADARISGDVDISHAYLRWNDEQIEAVRSRGRVEPSIDGGAAEIGGDAWFDGCRAEGLVRLRRATVRRAVGMRDVAYGAIAVFCADGGDAVRDRALLVGAAVADAAEAAARDNPADEDAQRTARQARLAATAEGVASARSAPPPRQRRRRGAADPPEFEAGLLSLDLAGLRSPDLVVAPAQPLHGDVDLSRAVTISFTDNGNMWRARHLDLLGMEYQLHIDLDAEHGTADWHTQLRRLQSTKLLPPPSTLRTDVALPAGQLSQPYLQLAAVYRATGSDSVARRVLFEMRRREWAQRTAAPAGPSTAGQRVRRQLLRLVSLLYRTTVGYGYRLQLALYWLAGLWLAGLVVFALLGPAEHPDPRPVVGADGRTSSCVVTPEADPVAVQPGYCGRFTPALYSIDLLIPVVDLGQKSSWHYRDDAMQAVAGLLQVAGWILATAAATAALGLVGRAD
jgi:hypothetical protein